jgi:hypothetical protein
LRTHLTPRLELLRTICGRSRPWGLCPMSKQ